MTNKTVWVCSHCGSEEVYADAWVGVNDADDVLGPYSNYFCKKCDGECSIKEKDE